MLNLLRQRTSQLTHTIPQFIQPAYAKPVDIVGYYKKQVKNQVEQDLYNVANENHNKINHGDYIHSNFLLKYGQEDKYRNKLLKDRMQQLGLTSYDFKPSETSLTIGNDDEEVNKLDILINDFVLKVRSGLFDISMLSELNEIFKIIQLKAYRFSNELLNKYLEYFDDMIAILNEEDTKTVATEKGLSGEAVLRSIANILIRCTEIIKMLLNTSGKTVDDKKIIVSEFIKSQKFKQIETVVIKYISGKINDLKKELKKAEKKKQKEVSKKMDKQIKTMEKIEEAVRATPIDTSRFIFDEAGISPIPSVVFDDGENDEFEGPPRLEPLRPATPEASSPPPEIVPEANDIDELNTAIGKDVDLINKLVKRKEMIADDDTKSQEQKSIAISAINTSIVKIQKEIDEYRRQIRAVEAEAPPERELLDQATIKELMNNRSGYIKTITNIMEGTTKLRTNLTDIIINVEISDNTDMINSVITQIERNKEEIDIELDRIEQIENRLEDAGISIVPYIYTYYEMDMLELDGWNRRISSELLKVNNKIEEYDENVLFLNIKQKLELQLRANDAEIEQYKKIINDGMTKIPDEMEAIIMPDGRPPAGEEKEEIGEPEPDAEEDDEEDEEEEEEEEEEEDEMPKPKPKKISKNKQVPYPEDISSKGNFVTVDNLIIDGDEYITKLPRQLKDILFKKQPADIGKAKKESTRLRAIEKNDRKYSETLNENFYAIKEILKRYGYKESEYKAKLRQIDADYPDKDERNKQRITYLFNNFLLTSTKMIVPATGMPLFIRDKDDNKGGKRKTK